MFFMLWKVYVFMEYEDIDDFKKSSILPFPTFKNVKAKVIVESRAYAECLSWYQLRAWVMFTMALNHVSKKQTNSTWPLHNAQECSAFNTGCATFPIPTGLWECPTMIWWVEISDKLRWCSRAAEGQCVSCLCPALSSGTILVLCVQWYYKDFKDDTVESPKQGTGFSMIFRNSYDKIQYE